MRGKAPIILLAVSMLIPAGRAACGELFDEQTIEFARALDAPVLGRLPVQYGGRVGVLDTLARRELTLICGQAEPDGLAPAFAYLELYFNAGTYLDAPVIRVRSDTLRRVIAPRLAGPLAVSLERTGRLPPICLLDDQARSFLLATDRATLADLTRCEPVPSLAPILAVLARRPENRLLLERLQARAQRFLAVGVLRLLPQTAGHWIGPDHLRVLTRSPATTSAPAALLQLAQPLGELETAWRARDAEAVNRSVRTLTARAHGVAPRQYPSLLRRRLEVFYNRARQGTLVLGVYAAALVMMIVALATRAPAARKIGLGLFTFATALLLAGFVIRWVLSGRRWYLPPIMNQFEAVIGSALLGCLVALMAEAVTRRNWFALAASLYAVVCLLTGLVLPEPMGAVIRMPSGILHSPIMAAHVAVIIVAHAMVGMTFVISLIYLVGAGLFGRSRGRPGSLDRCNLIAAQFACWTLCAGTALGALWADRAWGRWWGWDPKETWAVLTCLIYIAILHVRWFSPPARRGVVTAVGCVLGTGAMLFNWIVVNYLMPGLHSYA